ncbi:YgiW/YdeI family stress tolerance OB fold protein [Photobacterium alginatilyticum]|uniref:NirD/YgiW/YdeI family stress tolerance protein n=1 Tax=Photobacterium alginatilyticum TaxID=1775171 RepID=A0ABW9YCR5_9GAMM|nr:NirD/YgiW/YdeI family stress tolerance protein [Photobacterium alginatilyticum]NBI51096.1 NirD/YgiW/YdeI family stress tolerance protein [Photobacterium alginatilyticum]
MIKTTVYAITAAMIIMPTVALANPNGLSYSGPIQTITVSEVLEQTNLFSEQNVILEGKLIKQINADTYVFSDGNDEINVEIDDDIRLEQTITANTRLRVYGEVEGGTSPEIEIDKIQVL